jgi:hypothetical protein
VATVLTGPAGVAVGVGVGLGVVGVRVGVGVGVAGVCVAVGVGVAGVCVAVCELATAASPNRRAARGEKGCFIKVGG